MALGKVAEVRRVRQRRHDLDRLDDARPGPVEECVSVGDVNRAVGRDCTQSLGLDDVALVHRARNVEPAAFDHDQVGFERGEFLWRHGGSGCPHVHADRDSAGGVDHFGHPRPAQHDRVDPLEARDAGSRGEVGDAPPDVFDAGGEVRAELGAVFPSSERRGDAFDVVEDVFEPCRTQAHDVDVVVVGKASDGCTDVIERHGADLAEILCHDDAGRELSEELVIDAVDAESVLDDLPDGLVDAEARALVGDASACQRRTVGHRRREIALVRNPDEPRLTAECADDLGCGGEKRDDPRDGRGGASGTHWPILPCFIQKTTLTRDPSDEKRPPRRLVVVSWLSPGGTPALSSVSRHTSEVQSLFTREESRDVDRVAVRELGVESLVLMENAGRGAAEAIVDRFSDCLSRVALVGGPGQNGGDAWVIARRLTLLGASPHAILVGDLAKVRGDAKTNWSLLEKLGARATVLPSSEASRLAETLEDATLIVDGLFGTGLDRPITGGYAAAVQALEDADAPVVALDLPSGLDANTGAILGVAAHAAMTVTFAGLKRGLHQYPGVEFAGDVRVADIGIPVAAATHTAVYDRHDLDHLVDRRSGDAHKGTNGHLLVVGGAPGKTGAALLAGRAAFRAGAGLVTLGARSDARAALEEKVVELMTVELPRVADQAAVEALCEGKRAVVVGPGIGLDEAGVSWTMAFARHAPVPVIIDADGITNLASDLDSLTAAAGPRILTPHPGEAARLLGSTTSEVQSDRYAAAASLAAASTQTIVLKGARTIVASRNRMGVCAEGTPALGVAGTGDVLSGVTGTLAMTRDPFEASLAATLVHALAGEAASVTDRGLLASEVADAVPGVFADVLGD